MLGSYGPIQTGKLCPSVLEIFRAGCIFKIPPVYFLYFLFLKLQKDVELPKPSL